MKIGSFIQIAKNWQGTVLSDLYESVSFILDIRLELRPSTIAVVWLEVGGVRDVTTMHAERCGVAKRRSITATKMDGMGGRHLDNGLLNAC